MRRALSFGRKPQSAASDKGRTPGGTPTASSRDGSCGAIVVDDEASLGGADGTAVHADTAAPPNGKPKLSNLVRRTMSFGRASRHNINQPPAVVAARTANATAPGSSSDASGVGPASAPPSRGTLTPVNIRRTLSWQRGHRQVTIEAYPFSRVSSPCARVYNRTEPRCATVSLCGVDCHASVAMDKAMSLLSYLYEMTPNTGRACTLPNHSPSYLASEPRWASTHLAGLVNSLLS